MQDALEELKADIDEKADPADVVDTGFGEMPSGITMSGMIGGEAAIGTDTDHDLDFAPFLCKDSTNAVVIYSTDSISKQLDAAWSAGGTPGTPAGGLLNGTIAANTVYLWVYMGDGASGVDVGFLALADIADIATHVTAAGFDYYKVGGFRHTNASSNWAGFTQTGDYLIGWKSDDNIISNSVTTTLATKTHANHIADDYTELICYGARDATDNGTLYASDDGTNISLVVGRATVSVSTTDQHAWGEAGQANTAFVPYLASRQFASSNATIDLLLHGVKFKR